MAEYAAALPIFDISYHEAREMILQRLRYNGQIAHESTIESWIEILNCVGAEGRLSIADLAWKLLDRGAIRNTTYKAAYQRTKRNVQKMAGLGLLIARPERVELG